jgi:hypothetical protein
VRSLFELATVQTFLWELEDVRGFDAMLLLHNIDDLLHGFVLVEIQVTNLCPVLSPTEPHIARASKTEISG